MQTKTQSLIESLVNIAIGYGVAVSSQIVVFRLMGIAASLSQNIEIGVWFTLISLIRSYCVRRVFNRWHR